MLFIIGRWFVFFRNKKAGQAAKSALLTFSCGRLHLTRFAKKERGKVYRFGCNYQRIVLPIELRNFEIDTRVGAEWDQIL